MNPGFVSLLRGTGDTGTEKVVLPSQLLVESLARKVAVSGLEGVSATLLDHLRQACQEFSDLKAQGESLEDASPLECRVFNILCQHPTSGFTSTLSDMVRGMSLADKPSFVHEWGASAINAWLQKYGEQAFEVDSSLDSVIEALSGAAQIHPENADVATEVCKAFLTAIKTGGTHLEKHLGARIMDLVLVALEIHQSNLNVQHHVLQVTFHFLQDATVKEDVLPKVVITNTFSLILKGVQSIPEAAQDSKQTLPQVDTVLLAVKILDILVNDSSVGDEVCEELAFLLVKDSSVGDEVSEELAFGDFIALLQNAMDSHVEIQEIRDRFQQNTKLITKCKDLVSPPPLNLVCSGCNTATKLNL